MGLFSRKQVATSAPEEQRDYSISDPALAFLFDFPESAAGFSVSETTALNLTGFYRATKILTSTVAGLSLKTYRETPDGRIRVSSFLDNPAGPNHDQTAYEWMETLVCHLVIHGQAFGIKQFNGFGVLVGIIWVHPSCVALDIKNGQKFFTFNLADGTRRTFTTEQVLHVPGLSSDGYRGISPIFAGRNAISTSLAAEDAAGRLYRDGVRVRALVTPEEEDLDSVEAAAIQEAVNNAAASPGGAFMVVSKLLKISPWQLNTQQLEFLASRKFQLSEIARITGVPTSLLMEAEGGAAGFVTSVIEMTQSFSRFTVFDYVKRIEARLNSVLEDGLFAEMDLYSLERPMPESENALLLSQLNGGAITLNQYLAIRNLPVAGPEGDEYRVPSGVMLLSQLAPLDEPDSGTEPEVAQAIALAGAAPSLVQNPGLPALVDQLRILNGKQPLQQPVSVDTPVEEEADDDESA